MGKLDFTCGHCKAKVLPTSHRRNSCPECHWSKHVMMGTEAGCPPCGGMMKPVRSNLADYIWECQGCPFTIKGPGERELKRIRRNGKKVSWRMGVQGGRFPHQVVEYL